MNREELDAIIKTLPDRVLTTPAGGSLTMNQPPGRMRANGTTKPNMAKTAMEVAMAAIVNDEDDGKEPDFRLRENFSNSGRIGLAVEKAVTANRFATRLTRIEDNG